MSMTSSDSRAGLRILGAAGLVGGYVVFGMPAAMTSTWGSVGEAAATAGSQQELTALAIWISLGLLAMIAGVVTLAVIARRRRAARRPQVTAVASAPATSARRVPAHA